MTKDLNDVIKDVYHLFDVEHEVNEENLKEFTDNIAETVKNRLAVIQSFQKPTLRVSKLGVKDRKLYYELYESGEEETDEEIQSRQISPSNCIKFLYGDIVEELLLLLIKEAGHTVEGEQGEVEIDGVIGHRDCIIDGVTVDIKTASSFAFQKFEKGTLHKDDPFGYIAQISSYVYADKSPYGAFLAMNKESGQLALLKIDGIDMIHPPTRIAHVRKMLAKDSPPEEKCYDPVPLGKSGNMVLSSNCGYCAHKTKCWASANNGKGLRKFQYSNAVKYFVDVKDTPRVPEII